MFYAGDRQSVLSIVGSWTSVKLHLLLRHMFRLGLHLLWRHLSFMMAAEHWLMMPFTWKWEVEPGDKKDDMILLLLLFFYFFLNSSVVLDPSSSLSVNVSLFLFPSLLRVATACFCGPQLPSCINPGYAISIIACDRIPELFVRSRPWFLSALCVTAQCIVALRKTTFPYVIISFV